MMIKIPEKEGIKIKYAQLKVFFLVLLLQSFSFAQMKEMHFEHIAVEDGLSSNTVLCLLQDSRGFLWIGTYNGLNRYDGYDFLVYKNSLKDSTSLSGNMIRALCEDNNGDIWIGTWHNGLNKFIREKEKFKHYFYNPDNPSSISSDYILSMCKDKTGNLWIGTDGGGLNYFDVRKESFQHYKNNPNDPRSLSDNSIYNVYVDKSGTLWCGTANSGLNKFDEKERKFTVFKNSDTDPESICGNQIVTIFEDHFGFLWVGSRDAGLNKFDRSTNKSIRYVHDPQNPNSLADYGVWVVYESSDGLLWVGNANNGLSLFDRKKESFSCFRKNYNDPESLSDDAIFTIYEDQSSVLWFGTWSGGLNKYDRKKEKFVTYTHDPNNINSISGIGVYAIFRDKSGILWVGTESSGLNKIDYKNNKYSYYQYNPNDRTSISSDLIYSICEDTKGNLWVGTYDQGLNKLDILTNKFQRFQHNPNDPNSLGNDRVTQIFCDSYGDLWIGSSDTGIDKLKKNDNNFIHYKNNPNDKNSVSSKLIYCFYEDALDNLWIGTYGDGLMMYNRKTDNFKYYKHDPNNPSNSLSSNIISSICEDKDGILWIGTNGSGLNRFDRRKKQYKHYGEKDGLANDVIFGILNDENGNLWISTGWGISRFNIKMERFKNYDSRDGLQGNEFNQGASFKDSNGKMYFGGANGFNVFNPTEIIDNPVPPEIAIIDFQILHKPVAIGYDSLWGRTILEKSITETKLIKLNHDDNVISFELAALDFHSPERNQYAYFLEGFDKGWTRANASHRIITYTNLDPGEYTLKVKGSNNDGVWNEAGISLKIIISSPWWATWWAYSLYAAVLLLIMLFIRQYDLRRQRLRHQLELEHEHSKKLEEVDQLKSSFYTNISHEFRTPLMLILGPVEKLLSKITDNDNRKQISLIKGNANRLLNLINQLLDLSKIEAGKLKLQASVGNIAQFVKGLVMEFDSVAERKDITLKINLKRENIEAYFDKEKLEKIITNIMSNAIKFTHNGGVVAVNINLIDHSVEILVRDTGIGIPKSKLQKIFDKFYQVDGSHTREYEGTGIGLALTKELVELHKGQIFIDSEEGKWTEVKLYFPLGRIHLPDDEIVEPIDFEIGKIKPEEVGIKMSSETEDTLNDNLVDKTIVLLVEDNSDVREYIREALQENYYFEEAANGEQGLRKAEKLIPDLIISDVMMPKMDGYEMMKKIKQDEKTSHIPIILLTAKSDKDSKLEGLGLGADDYITKPFDTAELLARIRNLIDMRRLLQEKFSRENYTSEKIAKPKLSSIDENFMNRIMSVIEEHLSEEEFSIEEFGKDVGMSRSQMHRKLKALTGKSASVYLRTVRLTKAKQMIKEKKGTISEISYKVGFSSPAYFSRCFKEEFGYTPSEHAK